MSESKDKKKQSDSERLARKLHREYKKEEFSLRDTTISSDKDSEENTASTSKIKTKSKTSRVVQNSSSSESESVGNLGNMATSFTLSDALNATYGRFAGRLNEVESKDIRLTSYTVERWISDTEARCASKKLLKGIDWIKKARLGAHLTKGDAMTMLDSPEILDIQDWDVFTSFARKRWQTEARKEPLMIIGKMVDLDPVLDYTARYNIIIQGCRAICEDVRSKPNTYIKTGKKAEWDDTETEDLVRVKDIVNYFGIGIFWSKITPSERGLYKKIELTMVDPIYASFSEFLRLVDERSKKKTISKVEIVNQTQEENINLLNKVNKMNSGTGQVNKSQVNKVSSRGNFSKPKCHYCGKLGHYMKECRNIVCYNCNGKGHLARDCRKKMKHVKKQTNVHVAQDDTLDTSSSSSLESNS